MKTEKYDVIEKQDLASADTKELGEAVDMIKDLSEAAYYCIIAKSMEESKEEKEVEEKILSRMGNTSPMMNNNSAFFNSPSPDMMEYPYGRRYFRQYPDEYFGRPYEYPMMYNSGGNSGGNSGSSNYATNNGGGNNGGSGGNGSSSGNSRNYNEGGYSPMQYLPQYMRDAREGRSGMSRRTYMEAQEQHQDENTQMMKLKEYISNLTDDVTEMAKKASPTQRQEMQQNISKISNLISQMK